MLETISLGFAHCGFLDGVHTISENLYRSSERSSVGRRLRHSFLLLKGAAVD
jgi:hypothetical protein